MFSLLYTFCVHFNLINIHVFSYLGSRLSGLFTEVPTGLDNRGSTVFNSLYAYTVYTEIFTLEEILDTGWMITCRSTE